MRAGGIDSVTSTGSVKTYRYDPVANTWDDAAIADLPDTRWGSACAFYNGHGVLAGGYVAGSATANISTTASFLGPGQQHLVKLAEHVGRTLADDRRDLEDGCFHVVGGRSIASSAFVGTNDNQKLCCAGTLGKVTNCANPALPPVAGVTMSLHG